MKFGGGGFKMPHVGKAAAAPKFSAPKIHPAANFKTKVRLPDTQSIGADPAFFSPNAGKV